MERPFDASEKGVRNVVSRLRVVGFVLAGLAALGCAGQPASPSKLPPGATAVRVVNDIDDAYELAGLSLTVDGEPLPVAAIPPRGSGATTTLRLAPGQHTVAARAIATSTARQERVVVGTQQHFVTGDDAVRVVVRVFT